MTDAATTPSAADLFQKWKQFLEAGTHTTATFVAAEHPVLIPEVQRLIDEYLAEHGAGSTLTGGIQSTEPPAAPDIPGYRVEAYLGGGGMGEVWRVRDPLDRPFALKLVRADRLTAAARERFLAEGRAMDQLGHRHLVSIHHFGIHGDLPYFLMRPYPASLKDRLADYQADPKAAVRLMAAVAEGVGHLHDCGYVHRDLKPGNVLLDDDGTPKVSDFGLVKSLSEESTLGDPGGAASDSAETFPTGARRSKTLTGAVIGTRAYMSPEQAAGGQPSPRWDVWALGVMLHELLTGLLPPSSAAAERLLDPNEPDNPPPSSFKAGLDPKVERIVQKCLSRDEAERYAHGHALAAQLRGCLRRGHRRRRLAIAIAVLVAISVTAVGVAWSPRKPDPLSDIQSRLRQGQTVEVIPEAGMPNWYDLAVGKELVQPYQSDRDGALAIDTSKVVLMDMPPTGLDRYQFEVQVRQASDATGGLIGIYAGRHRVGARRGEADCFLALWFNDRQGRREMPKGTYSVGAYPHQRSPGISAMVGAAEFETKTFLPPNVGTYHTLGVEVRPTGARFFFDGQASDPIPFPVTDQTERDLFEAGQLIPGTKTDFSPAGGYGVVVFGGSGAFRLGTVYRLPEP